MDYHCSTVFLSVVIRSTVFRFVVVVPELWMLVLSYMTQTLDCRYQLCGDVSRSRASDRTRSGPVQQALKARAMRLLKQKKMYEGQRDMLYNQTFNLDQVSFAAEGLKDAQQTSFGHHHQQGRNFLRKEHHFLIMLETYPLPRTLSRNKLNGTIPVSLTGLPNLINLLLDSNNLNGQIPQTLFQIPKYNFTGNNLNCGVGQPHPCVSEVVRSGIDIKDTNVMCSWMLQIVVLLRTSTSEPE
uniref:Uncharacterized protein n=1 Tax=Brassica oleracea var. oleracea TaxID=109376 RepID=A0A0D3D483_BRAOL